MKKSYLFTICISIFYFGYSQPAITLNSFGSGFDRPVSIKHAGDDRLFIVEQEGLIQILNADGTTNATPFLDIQNIVVDIGGIGDERGFFGLAFHPDYTTNGFFFVNYINNSGNTVVSRFTVSAGNVDIANPNSEQIILTITQPFSNHNGGDLAFGSDGFLYIASGDGGSAGDPQDHGQRLNSLLGKLLRIDVDNGSPYGIPADNPFFNDGNADTLDEIWAYGLRNPWKFSFDRQTNDLWIADVGQSNKEEINMALPTEAGLNYGWRCYEGNSEFNTTGCPGIETLTFPIDEYNHGGSPFRCSITGGYRYRGIDNPSFSGLYFFADYCSDEIGYAEFSGGNWSLTFASIPNTNGWSTFGEDINGELYIAGLVSGNIFKLVDGNLSVNEFNQPIFKMYPNPVDNELNFDFNENIPLAIRFYDLQGKLISEASEFDSSLLTISTKNLSQGLYIVQVLNTNSTLNFKKLIVK
ncbi:MAG: hypothetical protein DRI75_00745 [Bacteroidetes bacterium]|nr:MAG: hypothetical protein DRI75_00745 [Bacteroidota bacterium]